MEAREIRKRLGDENFIRVFSRRKIQARSRTEVSERAERDRWVRDDDDGKVANAAVGVRRDLVRDNSVLYVRRTTRNQERGNKISRVLGIERRSRESRL